MPATDYARDLSIVPDTVCLDTVGPDTATDDTPTADTVFVRTRLRPYLRELLGAEETAWKQRGAPSHDAVDALAAFMDGGKSLRPRFCFWGHRAGGDGPESPHLLAACAALELLHAFALIHDDLMDASPTRRGNPALQHQLTAQHCAQGWAGGAEQYGTAVAMLAGDLAFALASRLAAGLPPRAQEIWHELVAELTCGQYMDMAGAARGDRSVEVALTIARLKSGRYTVAGPLRLGAALAPGNSLDAALGRFGEMVGEAFQLRDDLLGVFGDPRWTGKPVGDDLRSGKPTLLLAYATRQTPPHRAALLARVGSPDLSDPEIAAITAACDECGARERVEQRIERDLRAAQRLALASDVTPAARGALCALARSAAHRCS